LVILAPLCASAQDKELVPDKVESKTGAGWGVTLGVGASFSFAHSSHVVGSQDGQTWNIGPSIDFGFSYIKDANEWRNTLAVREIFTRTPLIDEFVKTVDTLKFESIYLYHFKNMSWLGPFVRFQLDTSIFPTKDVRAADVVYNVDGADRDPTDRLDLAESFAPLHLKQSLGLFAQPVDKPHAKVEFRAGAGARETMGFDALAVNDKDGTDAIEVTSVLDFNQLGGELFGGISGTVTWEKLGPTRPLLYAISIESLLPFYSSEDAGKDFVDLISVEFDAKLGIKLFEWMSLDYNLRVVRQLLVVDELQIQNNLLLNFGYSLL